MADRSVILSTTAGGIINCPPVRSSEQRRKAQFTAGVAESGVAVLETEDKKAKEWDGCKQLISTLNFSPEEADKMLGKAFGWENSPYWGEERSKEIPEKESVKATLDHLRSLGLSDDDLYKVLKKFPEVLGCDLEGEVKTNIAALDKDWGIRGKTLRSLLLRNPKVLGYNVDCKGDCIAKCTRCWVRF